MITPLNGVMYNSQSRNLSAHGLHPRMTHALVNMPLLFLLPYLLLLTRLRQAGARVRRCGLALYDGAILGLSWLAWWLKHDGSCSFPRAGCASLNLISARLVRCRQNLIASRGRA